MLNAIGGSVFVRDAMSQPVTWMRYFNPSGFTDRGIDVVFNGSNLSSGVYFYKLETTDFIQVKKLVLIK